MSNPMLSDKLYSDYWQQCWQRFRFLHLHPGVFFAVCMAMLMLSLTKSILVVKLLHHSEKEVRQMSVSACLLDKYGSGGHDLTESALTSIKTLDHVNPSDGKLQAQRLKSFTKGIPNVFLLYASLKYSQVNVNKVNGRRTL